MRMAMTVLVLLLALVMSPLGASHSDADPSPGSCSGEEYVDEPDPRPYADPEYIDSGGTTQLYGATYVFDNMSGTWFTAAWWEWTDNGAGGTFYPSKNVKNPFWTAPGNHTGTYADHLIQVTVGLGTSITDTWSVHVYEDADPHYVTVTASVSPTSIESGGTVSLSGSATCSEGHAITSWRWTANVAGGTFDPTNETKSPKYIAPINTTSSDILVTFTLRAECSGGLVARDDTNVPVHVHPVEHAVTLTASCDPPAIRYGETTQCSAEFSDNKGHGVAWWLWDDGGAGGSFVPSAEVQDPVYQAPPGDPDILADMVLTVTAECDGPSPITASDSIDFGRVVPLTVLSMPIEDVYVSTNVADLLGEQNGKTPCTLLWEGDTEFLLEYNDLETDEQGCTFSHWTLDGEDQPEGDSSVSVTMDGQKTAVAHFYRFPDVKTDHWAYSYIEACYTTGVVEGYADGLYHSEWPVDRGQMAVYIARALAGGDEHVPDGPATPTFVDVPNTGCGESGTEPYWAYKYVEYAVDQNVIQGYEYEDPEHPGETLPYYEPLWNVTRDQMAVYVARARGWVGLGDDMTTAPELFPDVPAGFWSGRAIEACVMNRVVQGYLDGNYYPYDIVTRDQMAVYVARAFGLLD